MKNSLIVLTKVYICIVNQIYIMMKKSLLAMAAVMLLASTADAMYLIGEPAGAWDPSVGIEMEQNEDGSWSWSGEIGSSQYFGFATELGESGDWATFNSLYRLNPSTGDGTVAEPGMHDLVLGGMDGAFRGCGAPVTLTVSNLGDTYQLEVVAEGEVPPTPPADEQWSLIGAFNGWDGDVPMVRSEENGNVWSVTMDQLEGEFKFRCNADWAVNFGYAGDDVVLIESDCELPMMRDGYNFSIAPATDVTLTIDVAEGTLSVSGMATAPQEPRILGLVGSMNDWAWEWSYMLMENIEGSNVYTLWLDALAMDWEFKIVSYDGTEEFSCNDMMMMADQLYMLDSNPGNMKAGADYTDVFMTLDLNEGTLSFTGTQVGDVSVKGIEAADADAVYYNMQGVRVENPENGIFVRVANGRASKVSLK